MPRRQPVPDFYMKNKTISAILTAILVTGLLAGCATVYSSIVTLTSVVDTTMKAWADLSVAGKTTPDIDKQVVNAHEKYRQACGVAQAALITAKTNGDQTPYVQAIAIAKVAAQGILDIVAPILLKTDPAKAATIQKQLAKANKI